MNAYEIQKIGDILKGNSYPGRSIVAGQSADGSKAAVAYFIMGRSENSRNRVFVEQGRELVIHPFDQSKVKDPSLIIYSPLRYAGKSLIVTNGDQTDTICDFLQKGRTFEEALHSRTFEPDAPNFTPRISAELDFEPAFSYRLSILKSLDREGHKCGRFFFSCEPQAGLGHFIHTYAGDGNPLPSFVGEPERVCVPNSAKEFADVIWSNLNGDNKISLYVRFIDLHSGAEENCLFNKNK